MITTTGVPDASTINYRESFSLCNGKYTKKFTWINEEATNNNKKSRPCLGGLQAR